MNFFGELSLWQSYHIFLFLYDVLLTRTTELMTLLLVNEMTDIWFLFGLLTLWDCNSFLFQTFGKIWVTFAPPFGNIFYKINAKNNQWKILITYICKYMTQSLSWIWKKARKRATWATRISAYSSRAPEISSDFCLGLFFTAFSLLCLFLYAVVCLFVFCFIMVLSIVFGYWFLMSIRYLLPLFNSESSVLKITLHFDSHQVHWWNIQCINKYWVIQITIKNLTLSPYLICFNNNTLTFLYCALYNKLLHFFLNISYCRRCSKYIIHILCP